MRKIYLSLMIAATLAGEVNAQSIEIENVSRSRFTGVKPIISEKDESISGYYTYYMLEKEKGIKTIEFALIDKDLKKANKAKIEMHKYADINNTLFNGKYFLISYDDVKNKKSVYNVLDETGKIIKTKEDIYEKKREVGTVVYPAAEGEGFYIVKNIDEKRGEGYSIEKVDNNLKQIWIKEQVEVKSRRNIADLINTADRFIIWEEVTVKGKIKPQIVCFNAKNGDKIYERDGYDGSSTILYNQLRIDKDGGLLAGGAYVDKEKYSAVNNDGIYLLKLDPRGKELLYTKVSNEEKIQSVLKAQATGFSVGSKDKVYVEDLIVEGNNIIVVSEMFSKNINITPAIIQQTRDLITGKSIGAPTDNNDSKFVVEINDFILFKFNQKGELIDIKPISKEDKNKVTVWAPYSGYGGMALAKSLDVLGWFDYGFTVKDKDSKGMMICSNNASPRKPEVFMYNLSDNYAQKKINLKQAAKIDLEKGKVSYFKTLKNSNAKIAVAYYQPKLERITINLEDIK